MVYSLFSQYGRVMDIVAKKGVKNRGQAWVVFQDVSAATNALRGKQGFIFYGKPMVSILISIPSVIRASTSTKNISYR